MGGLRSRSGAAEETERKQHPEGSLETGGGARLPETEGNQDPNSRRRKGQVRSPAGRGTAKDGLG